MWLETGILVYRLVQTKSLMAQVHFALRNSILRIELADEMSDVCRDKFLNGGLFLLGTVVVGGRRVSLLFFFDRALLAGRDNPHEVVFELAEGRFYFGWELVC